MSLIASARRLPSIAMKHRTQRSLVDLLTWGAIFVGGGL